MLVSFGKRDVKRWQDSLRANYRHPPLPHPIDFRILSEMSVVIHEERGGLSCVFA